jgi:hypothetical protein
LLQRIKKEGPTVSTEAENVPQSTGSYGFRIVHPPVTTSSAAPDDNQDQGGGPLSSGNPPQERRERGLW